MIVITGAAGFIGSCMAAYFNQQRVNELVLVDKFTIPSKQANYQQKNFLELVERDEFLSWLMANHRSISWVIHLGARTDTTEFDSNLLDRLNLQYSKDVWHLCTNFQLPLIYASSAATYGLGEHGYFDNHEIVKDLQPLNPYGISKNEFDKWVLQQPEAPPHWYGLKFFNVYGPNEYHKERMASVIFHAFNQIRQTGGVKLFRSHHPDFEDGMQLRDFVYVKDVVKVMAFLKNNCPASGLYNLGTAKADTFLNLAHCVFEVLQLPENINFIDIPIDIRNKYQYYTQADMKKLRAIGYVGSFTTLSEGVQDYVSNYLMEGKRW